MNNEIIESIFGCLERIEEKLDKQPVQTEQGERENSDEREDKTGELLATVLLPLADSIQRTNRNLCTLRDVMKICSDHQKKDKEELTATIERMIQTSAYKDESGMADEVRNLKHEVLEQLSKPQHRKVTHDLTTNTWWLVGVGIVLFFCMFLLTSKIYKQSKEIDRLDLSDWKYRALRATLPSNNVNVIWLERNVWRGNDKGIRQCQQFVINYEDSIRRRYEMMQDAAMRDSIGRLLIHQSKKTRKELRMQ